MKITENFTARGFKLKEFVDLYGCKCNIQKSSLTIWKRFGLV